MLNFFKESCHPLRFYPTRRDNIWCVDLLKYKGQYMTTSVVLFLNVKLFQGHNKLWCKGYDKN